MANPIITLTTDFGLHDAFVGIMKGVMLQIHSKVKIIDICHNISPHNILEASYIIGSAYSYFPKKTIHVIVIDPGVGSERKPIIALTDDYYFVAPDNGVLSYVYHQECNTRVFHITEKKYFRSSISTTFHGRDLFAPVGAWLATGVPPEEFGQEIINYKKFDVPQPVFLQANFYEFKIIHIDHFGNLITSIQKEFFQKNLSNGPGRGFLLEISDRKIRQLSPHFASLQKGAEIGAIIGSSGHIEIFSYQNRADQLLGVHAGDTGKIKFI